MTVKKFGVLSTKSWAEIKKKKKRGKTPSFIESSDGFITKPQEIANYFNNYTKLIQ